jgi:hypothetical protein
VGPQGQAQLNRLNQGVPIVRRGPHRGVGSHDGRADSGRVRHRRGRLRRWVGARGQPDVVLAHAARQQARGEDAHQLPVVGPALAATPGERTSARLPLF